MGFHLWHIISPITCKRNEQPFTNSDYKIRILFLFSVTINLAGITGRSHLSAVGPSPYEG
jgi:hypothetical protein